MSVPSDTWGPAGHVQDPRGQMWKSEPLPHARSVRLTKVSTSSLSSALYRWS